MGTFLSKEIDAQILSDVVDWDFLIHQMQMVKQNGSCGRMSLSYNTQEADSPQNSDCIICHKKGFTRDIPMCLDCALIVTNADDFFPPETYPVIKPLASKIINIVESDETL